jgi:hypothetical protein
MVNDAEMAIAVGTGALALGTGALAIVTFWLGWQTRSARLEARKDAERAILRSALAEALANCRAWHGRDPARGEPAWRSLLDAEPRLFAVSGVIDQLDLPADVVGYLIWLTSTIEEQWGRTRFLVDRLLLSIDPYRAAALGHAVGDSAAQSQLTDDWRAMLERLQVLAAVLAAEARRRGLADVAAPHDAVPWTVVPQRPPQWRELIAIGGLGRGDPPFPSDVAFRPASALERDKAGNITGARQMGALSSASRR